MRTMSSTTRMFSNPTSTGNTIRRTQTARERSSVAEEEENQEYPEYFEDDSDNDIKYKFLFFLEIIKILNYCRSHYESITTDAMSLEMPSGLPSITVADKQFNFENKRSAFRTRSTKNALKNSNLASSSGSEIDFARRRTVAEHNNITRPSSLVSALKRPALQKAKVEVQISMPITSNYKKNDQIVLDAALIAVKEIRESLNERLNNLVNQINTAAKNSKLTEQQNDTILSSSLQNNQSHFFSTPLESIGIVESADTGINMQQIQQRPHTPLSTTARSVSPSRVSFSSVKTTFRNDD